MDWCTHNNIAACSEPVLVRYFEELSSTYSSSSLWVFYSSLRHMLQANHNANIEQYSELRGLLKRLSKENQGKRFKHFTKEEVSKFLDEAPDQLYLVTKVSEF